MRAATVAVLLGIAVATLYPTRDPIPPRFAICLPCGELGALDLLLNVALFFPLGALLASQGSRRTIVLRVALISFLVSFAIEIAQLLVVNGRDPSLADIWANTVGGIGGGLAVTVIPRWWRGGRVTWRWMTWSWVLLSAALLAFGSWAVTTYVPYETYYVQWEPRRPNYALFLGRLTALSLDELPLTPGAVLAPSELPASFFDGLLSVKAQLTPGGHVQGTAIIARLALASGEFLTLARNGDAFVAHYLTNARRVGLRSPAYAVHGAFVGHPNATVTLQVETRRRASTLRAISTTTVLEHTHRASAARLWAGVLPVERAFGSLGTVVDALWLGVLFLVTAFGAARASGTRGALVPPLTLAAAAAVLAWTYDRALWSWPFGIAVATATAVGYWLGTRFRRVPATL